MNKLLAEAVRIGASDLHLTAGAPPFFRVNGEIVLTNYAPMAAEALKEAIFSLLNADQISTLEREWELCSSLTLPGVGYFRVTIYKQRGNFEASVRVGAGSARSFEELGLPASLADMARKTTGLILVTGPTGHGKTTTLSALIDFINKERRCKIITVEDPIEYVHANVKSVVVQQEVHADTKSFGRALVHILRQDPDVIAVGEMRDLETMSAALTAAETGHLVLATLHANDCAQAINRIVDVFPERQQGQIRFQLAMTLRCVINQRLLPRADGKGRVLAYGYLPGTAAVLNVIRENKLNQIQSVMEASKREGMVIMDEFLRDMFQKVIISYDTAVANALQPGKLLPGMTVAPQRPGKM